MQQSVMYVLLHQPGQQAEVVPLVFLDEFQKDDPGGVDCVLAQGVLHACPFGLLVDEGRKVAAQPVYGLLLAPLGCMHQAFELHGRVGEFFPWWVCDVVQSLSVAAFAAYDRILYCTASSLMCLLYHRKVRKFFSVVNMLH